MTELARDVNDAAPLVQQQAGEGVAQRVRRGPLDARRVERALERAPAPRLIRRLRPGRVFPAGEHERVVMRPTGCEPPLREVGLQRPEQPHRAVLGGLRVLLAAERERALDEDRVGAHVAPAQRKRLPGRSPA